MHRFHTGNSRIRFLPSKKHFGTGVVFYVFRRCLFTNTDVSAAGTRVRRVRWQRWRSRRRSAEVFHVLPARIRTSREDRTKAEWVENKRRNWKRSPFSASKLQAVLLATQKRSSRIRSPIAAAARPIIYHNAIEASVFLLWHG